MIAERHLHAPHVRFKFPVTSSLADDVAVIVAEHGKGCVVGASGECPVCTLAALHAIELRLLMEGTNGG
jgi:hypothetical protein